MRFIKEDSLKPNSIELRRVCLHPEMKLQAGSTEEELYNNWLYVIPMVTRKLTLKLCFKNRGFTVDNKTTVASQLVS